MSLVHDQHYHPDQASEVIVATGESIRTSPTESTLSKKYNQYACIRCRRLKKRCSKELPVCSNCEKQSECCEYVERKNKRKSVSTTPSNSKIQLKKIRESMSANDANNSNAIEVAITKNIGTLSNSSSLSDNESTKLSAPSLVVHNDPLVPNGQVKFNDPFCPNTLNNNSNILLSPSKKSLSISPPSYTRNSLIQLPPIRNRALSTQSFPDTLPPLSTYSLQNQSQGQHHHTLHNQDTSVNDLNMFNLNLNSLPSIPRQLVSSSRSPNTPHSLNSFSLNPSTEPKGQQQNHHLQSKLTPKLQPRPQPQPQQQHTGSFSYTQSTPLFNALDSDDIELEIFDLVYRKLDMNFLKATFTLSYKIFSLNKFPITNIQLLRLYTLMQLVILITDSNSNRGLCFYSNSILSKYASKLSLNRSLKKSNIDNISLSEIEYTYRLFWSIFILDSMISSTTFQQPTFKLNDIDIPLPVPITKDEETRIIIQNIVINMTKIQSKLISDLYVVNPLNDNDNSQKFVILSSFRQEADYWYNECRISLSKLSDINNSENSNSLSYTKHLQYFATWISQEYYYTLTCLFKSSNMFPKPDEQNFTVISNATYQNTLLIRDIIINKKVPNSLLFYRYVNTSVFLIVSILKGMYSINETKILVSTMIEIWNSKDTSLSKVSIGLVESISDLLHSQLKIENNNEFFKPNLHIFEKVKALLIALTQTVTKYGYLNPQDIEYLHSLEF
ncbi:Protein STB5 [Pichia kudriavzevii]|uniref:Protein STB5 n=1 Tax=Pichia kudriavzevii TaxID=4909 RepID=A0A1V2LP53_PICKU|nr:Protein STB5 [Pichia kudriavzevii]UQE86014.1 transcription factor [Pichia kudriavzevii]